MKRFWQRKPWNERQRRHRDVSFVIEDGCIMNGCVPMDDYAESVFEELESVSVEFGTLWESGDMPILKHDDAFKTWRKNQIEECNRLRNERITCTLPWQVLHHLPKEMKKSDRLYFTQGWLGSCAGHGDGFGHCSTTLQMIARGASLIYHSINPVVMWSITKGGSTRGGQCLAPDQLVYTATGTHRAAELAASGKPFLVLSYSKRLGRVAVKQAVAQYSTIKPCVRVTTDKGCFETSSDHPFMLSTGEFVHAARLQPGQSLFRVATDISSYGHVRVHLRNGKKGKAYLHRLVMSDICGIESPHVHHQDGVKTNNDIDNLVPLDSDEHARIHFAALQDKATEGKRRYFRTLNANGRRERTNHLHTNDTRKHHSQSQLLNSGYKIINSGHLLETESDFIAYHKTLGAAPSKIHDKLKRIINAFGGFSTYVDALRANNHRVVSVESTGMKRVITISVVDPELDDKRQWSEHNYVIVPEGKDGYAVNGVCVANSVAEIAKGANTIGHFTEDKVGTNNQVVPPYEKFLDDAKKFQSAILFLNFLGKELADEIIQCCAAGLSVPVANSLAVTGCTIDKNGVKVATLGGYWAHMTHFTAYRIVNGTEYIGWVNSHGPRYQSSDEGEPADMCWMARAQVEQFVASADGYGPPYVVFPESIATLDTTLYVKHVIPFPNHWRT